MGSVERTHFLENLFALEKRGTEILIVPPSWPCCRNAEFVAEPVISSHASCTICRLIINFEAIQNYLVAEIKLKNKNKMTKFLMFCY